MTADKVSLKVELHKDTVVANVSQSWYKKVLSDQMAIFTHLFLSNREAAISMIPSKKKKSDLIPP